MFILKQSFNPSDFFFLSLILSHSNQSSGLLTENSNRLRRRQAGNRQKKGAKERGDCLIMGMVCMFLFLFLFVCLLLEELVYAVVFKDVSIQAGLKRPYGIRIKYGGPAIADLDGDGLQDILCGHHDDRWADAYFNNGNGTFTRSDWTFWVDAHGFNPIRFGPWEKGMHFTVSRGGNYGTDPQSPEVFAVRRDRHIEDVKKKSGLVPYAAGRGRSAVFMRLNRYSSQINAIFTNLFDPRRSGNYHRAFAVVGAERWAPRRLKGPFKDDLNTYVSVTDIDNDGVMELVSFHHLRIYRVTKAFTLEDISASVLPEGVDFEGTVAVAELDFDCDGLWDLYIARTKSGDMNWILDSDMNDILLRNVGGRYEDVSAQAGIPRGTVSRGATVGDFNNDGCTDILVTRYHKQDLLLMNNGCDGTFTTRSAGYYRKPYIRGDMGAAVDLDQDGKIDVVLSEGDWLRRSNGGYYRIMKNITPDVGHWLLVRVMNSPTRTAISLHAVAFIDDDDFHGMRRVGSSGTAVSNSYIELLHFGLGWRKSVNRVTVVWQDGRKQSKFNVKAGQTITFGV